MADLPHTVHPFDGFLSAVVADSRATLPGRPEPFDLGVEESTEMAVEDVVGPPARFTQRAHRQARGASPSSRGGQSPREPDQASSNLGIASGVPTRSDLAIDAEPATAHDPSPVRSVTAPSPLSSPEVTVERRPAVAQQTASTTSMPAQPGPRGRGAAFREARASIGAEPATIVSSHRAPPQPSLRGGQFPATPSAEGFAATPTTSQSLPADAEPTAGRPQSPSPPEKQREPNPRTLSPGDPAASLASPSLSQPRPGLHAPLPAAAPVFKTPANWPPARPQPAVQIGTLDICIEASKPQRQAPSSQPVRYRGSDLLSRLYLRRV